MIAVEPEVPLAPDHAPVAEQLLASELVHDSVVLAPRAIVVGVATMSTVGAGVGVFTMRDAVFETEPPSPVQLRTKFLVPAEVGVTV